MLHDVLFSFGSANVNQTVCDSYLSLMVFHCKLVLGIEKLGYLRDPCRVVFKNYLECGIECVEARSLLELDDVDTGAWLWSV